MTGAPVLIAGGGPVGMTLAATLAHFGVRCTLVERALATTSHPKMDITNARSMELFRRLGLVGRLRAVAVPEDRPFDVAWITHLTGHELHRFRYPGAAAHRAAIRANNDGAQPAESPMRVSQVEIEPVLRAHVEASPRVDVRTGVELVDLAQDADGVDAVLRDVRTGATSRLRGAWLVGCDGAGSRVREAVGIGLSGDPRTSRRYMVHLRSRDALLRRWGGAWHVQSPDGTLIAQDDREVWTLHARCPDDVDPARIDPSALLARFVGQPVEHRVLVANPWMPRLLVADAYAHGRVLLAGDAAHQYIPTGGYGMNTGVGDAFDLGWKLAAVALGFGGPALLESYGPERRPVGLRNREASRRHTEVRVAISRLYGPPVYADGPAGEAARREAGRRIAELGNAENESWGIEWGYAYRDSPIVAREPGPVPPDDPLRYHPSTAPGVRLPSVVLPDGSLLFDRLGPWFTLLLTGPDAEDAHAGGFVDAARALGVPLTVLRLDAPALARLYEAPAVLVRPDHHVAWRGDAHATLATARSALARSVGRTG
jgi:2-polyprenyl-6-methoxyphenol hydroxylase-like FAD-dependent oxidoreductase